MEKLKVMVSDCLRSMGAHTQVSSTRERWMDRASTRTPRDCIMREVGKTTKEKVHYKHCNCHTSCTQDRVSSLNPMDQFTMVTFTTTKDMAKEYKFIRTNNDHLLLFSHFFAQEWRPLRRRMGTKQETRPRHVPYSRWDDVWCKCHLYSRPLQYACHIFMTS